MVQAHGISLWTEPRPEMAVDLSDGQTTRTRVTIDYGCKFWRLGTDPQWAVSHLAMGQANGRWPMAPKMASDIMRRPGRNKDSCANLLQENSTR